MITTKNIFTATVASVMVGTILLSGCAGGSLSTREKGAGIWLYPDDENILAGASDVAPPDDKNWLALDDVAAVRAFIKQEIGV